MNRLAWIALVSLMYSPALAETEIKGTPSELTQYLAGVPRMAQVTGEAEVRVSAHRAVLTLRVVTESRSLQEALRLNLEFRGRLAEHLRKQGISADRIQTSKFSSTPKYGMFSDKAKSYRVENMIRVAVQDEKEFQSAAAAVDQWPEIQYGEVEYEYTDKEALKAKAISQACDNANERKRIYEEKLGVKLVPATFNEGEIGQPQTVARLRGYGSSTTRAGTSDSSSAPSAEISVEGAASSFGELVYTARVTVIYSVQPK